MTSIHDVKLDNLIQILSQGTYAQALGFLSADSALRDLTDNQDFMKGLRWSLCIPEPVPVLVQGIEFESSSFRDKVKYLVKKNNLGLLERLLQRECPSSTIKLKDGTVNRMSIEAVRLIRSSSCRDISLLWDRSTDITIPVVSKRGATLQDVLFWDGSEDKIEHRIASIGNLKGFSKIIDRALFAGNVEIANAFLRHHDEPTALDAAFLKEYGNTETVVTYLKAMQDDGYLERSEQALALLEDPSIVSPALQYGIEEGIILGACLYFGYVDTVRELARLNNKDIESYLRDNNRLSLTDDMGVDVGAMYQLYSEIAASKGMTVAEYVVYHLGTYTFETILDEHPRMVLDLDAHMVDKLRSEIPDIDDMIRDAKDSLLPKM